MRIILGLLVLLMPAIAQSNGFGYYEQDYTHPEDYEPHSTLSARASINWGRVEGFVQTPDAGMPGSSSPKRPTFEELNIDDTVFYNVELHWQRNRTKVLLAGNLIQMDSSGTLENALTSQAREIPAGSSFSSDIAFDWYRMGIGYNMPSQNESIIFTPYLEWNFFDFSYKLTTPNQTVDRSYDKGVLRASADTLFLLDNDFHIKLSFGATLPVITHAPMIAHAAGELLIPVYQDWQDLYNISLFAGIGLLHIDYKDGQAFPNYIELDFQPYTSAGIAVQF